MVQELFRNSKQPGLRPLSVIDVSSLRLIFLKQINDLKREQVVGSLRQTGCEHELGRRRGYRSSLKFLKRDFRRTQCRRESDGFFGLRRP